MKKQKLHFSRLLSLALSLALLCTALSVPFSVSANDEGTATGLGTSATDPWNGTTISTSLEGTGSIGNPYKINNAADLAFLATKGATLWGNTPIDCIEVQGKYFELTADIYLNDVSNEWYKDPTGAEGLREWKNTSTCKYTSGGVEKTKTPLFTGKLNGNNHKIYGLYMNDSSATHGGLFSQVAYSAVIENLGIEKSYIAVSTSSGSAGAFAGQRADEPNTTVSIKNCYSSDTVTVKGQKAGGLVGNTYWKLHFTNCYSSAAVTDSSSKGGILGQAGWNGDAGVFAFTNCYSTQSGLTITGGASDKPTYTNCYATSSAKGANSTKVTALTKAKMTGDAAYTNMTGFDFNSVWHVFDGTPKLRAFGVSLEPEIWDGTVSSSLSLKDPSSTNSAANPYLINNAADLAFLATKGAILWGGTPIDCIEVKDKFFELTSDIYLNDVSTEWYKDPTGATGLKEWKNTSTCSYTSGGVTKTKTPSFAGKLNGNGHKIYGLYMNDSDATYGGLFSTVTYGAVIENLGIEKSYIAVSTSSGNAGAFAGSRADDNATTVNIKNCYSSDTVAVKGNKAGGLLGYSWWKFSFTNCYSSAAVTGNANKGGIVGEVGNNTEAGAFAFTNCYSTQSGLTITGGSNDKPTYTESYAMSVAGKWDNNNKTWTKIYQPSLTLAEMLGDGMTALATATDTNGEKIWFTNPKSTPKLAAFPIDGDVNGDKKVDICDLVLAKQVSLGSVTYKDINFATTNLDNSDELYTINELDINKIRAGKLLGLDF